MNYNNILISIIFFLSTSTVITNGILMINEKNKLNFSNLSSDNKGYVFALIYTEIFLCLVLIYNFIYYLYNFIFSCYSDNELKFNYSCWKALFLFSGIGIHIYLFFVLITRYAYIDIYVNTINVIFNINFFIIIFLTLIFKFLKCKNNKVGNYENLN
tara:strand:+ start:10417 stop:10887 length:471 start_codon:yes stop_codon:yes gene_type:complete